MSRIVAGALGGRRIAMPAGRSTRPTSDRVREALFSTLDSMAELAGARFADLYAGSGAVGLEALSRGASHVLLVEADQPTARTARDNVVALGVGPQVRLVAARVAQVLASTPDEPYDVVFADPPYVAPGTEVNGVLAALMEHGWLAPEAVVVVERSIRGDPVEWVPGVTGCGVRRYGETVLWYGRRS